MRPWHSILPPPPGWDTYKDFRGPSPAPARTPHKCPVCEGSGKLHQQNTYESTLVPQPKCCHACSGTGVVWG